MVFGCKGTSFSRSMFQHPALDVIRHTCIKNGVVEVGHDVYAVFLLDHLYSLCHCSLCHTPFVLDPIAILLLSLTFLPFSFWHNPFPCSFCHNPFFHCFFCHCSLCHCFFCRCSFCHCSLSHCFFCLCSFCHCEPRRGEAIF